MNKLTYLNRIFQAYVLKQHSHLSFWHGDLSREVNENTFKQIENKEKGWEFWQVFDYKADYPGPFDENGVIILDYRGVVGKQKYHIAISQCGLACYNRWKRTAENIWYDKFMAQVKWHEDNIRVNDKGIYLWYANFDWEYHGIHKAPWPSGLAQGNGLSLLVRAFIETKEYKYLEMCEKVFKSMITDVKDGGVMVKECMRSEVRGTSQINQNRIKGKITESANERVKEQSDEEIRDREWQSDRDRELHNKKVTGKNSETLKPCNIETFFWIEEVLMEPPTHILNGFMWAVMGIYDYYLLTRRKDVKMWFDRFTKTIADNLYTFDTGYWSLYEHSHTKIPMVASTFYHGLHLVQLEILYKITGNQAFNHYLVKWRGYQQNFFKKALAIAIKVVFKAVNY